MKTLHEILMDQKELVDAEWDNLEIREVLTNPQTLRDTNAIESWEF